MGRKPLARRNNTQLRNKRDPVIPAYTRPRARQLPGGVSWEWSRGSKYCTARAGGKDGGDRAVCMKALGLSDGGGKKEGRL